MERGCPECGAAVPVLTGFPDWCDRCGWNLGAPPRPWSADGRFARVADGIGRRAGERMARELAAADELAPRWTAAKAAAYALALVVHVSVLAALVAGIALIVATFPNPIALLIGLALAGAAFVMRPRIPRLPGGLALLRHSDAPALHELAAAVAKDLDRPPPDAIALALEWTAAWSEHGLRRQRVLILGLPLLAALDGQARVALVAHEIGHDRNGDVLRGIVVGSAVDALDSFAGLLLPDPHHRVAGGEFAGAQMIAAAFARFLALPVDALLWVLARLVMRDSQRAEYLADALGARVAGTDAMVRTLEIAMLHSAYELVVQQAAHRRAGGQGLIAAVREAIRSVPERERERRRRVARLETARLEATHPPTGMRLALLAQRTPRPPAIRSDAARQARIEAELEPFEAAADAELLEAYRSSLYSGWIPR